MRIRIELVGQTMTATLHDNPSARDLTIDDYSTNEEIAYLPCKLSEKGSAPSGNKRLGDLGYYAPWAIWRSSTGATDTPAG